MSVIETTQFELRSGRVEAPVRPKHSCAQPSTFWPDVSTFCGSFSDKPAQVEVRSGRVEPPARQALDARVAHRGVAQVHRAEADTRPLFGLT